MVSVDTPQKSYLLSGTYKSLRIAGHELGDLELAIVGYVSSGPQVRRGGVSGPFRTYPEIHELIFEYLKINSPAKIKDIIERNGSMLERERADTSILMRPELVKRIESSLVHYRGLQSRDVGSIEYSNFYTPDFRLLNEGQNPFSSYANRIVVGKLVKKGILKAQKKGGKNYLTLSRRTLR